MSKIKLAIVYNKLWHYRRETFEQLSVQYDLSLYFLEGDDYGDCSIWRRRLNKVQFGRFIFILKSFLSLLIKNDVVILYPDIAWINTTIVLMVRRIYGFGKLIIWTPGVSASYSKRFDAIKRWDKVRYFLYKGSDGIIVYSDYAKEKLVNLGFNPSRVFAANNTVKINRNDITSSRDGFLFIGTIYKAKGLDRLIRVYKNASERSPSMPKLRIVGDGPELSTLISLVEAERLSDRVEFLGRVEGQEEKKYLFSRSIFCLGPDQAGLGVLEAFGNGVPFVSTANAYTGGERLNIKSGYNGLFVSSIEDFYWLFLKYKNIDWGALGKNALRYYEEYASFENNLNSISNAIETVKNN